MGEAREVRYTAREQQSFKRVGRCCSTWSAMAARRQCADVVAPSRAFSLLPVTTTDVLARAAKMECSFGITGKGYTIIASDSNAARSIVKMKGDEDKMKVLSKHLVMAYNGESGEYGSGSGVNASV